jgi:hypothetical protein
MAPTKQGPRAGLTVDTEQMTGEELLARLRQIHAEIEELAEWLVAEAATA